MGEEKIRQEDCGEDGLGSGILTLTSRRLAFDKTESRMMDFTKRMGDTVLDVPLGDVEKVWKEGLLVKKICFAARAGGGENVYKFGVFNTGSWLKSIEDAVAENAQ